jgi:hypothetical protein
MAMPQAVSLTPAEQQLLKVILRQAPNFAARQWSRSVPLVTVRALGPYMVGLLSGGAGLLLTMAAYGGDAEIPTHWLFFVSVCLAIKAGGVKAGRVAAWLSVVSYFAVFVAPRSADWWQATHQHKVWHLTAVVVAMLLCTSPPGSYMRRMRRIIAWITAKTPVSLSSLSMRRNNASITAKVAVSSPRGLPWRLRSVSTS